MDADVNLDNPNYKVPPLRVTDEVKKEESRDKDTNQRRPRRFSVSAEESNEHSQIIKDVVRKIYPKKPEVVERIRNSVSEIFIWKGLDKEQQSSLIDAMFEKKVRKGEDVIKQGDKGDYFYVIESGIFEVWKASDPKQDSLSKKIFRYDGKGSFGELALLYNAPRAATVRAVTDGLLWAVDGETFRYIMISSRAKKRARFDDFLKTVDLFRNIDDILEVFQFEKGEYVISQGDENAEHFFIIQHGSVEVTLNMPRWDDHAHANTITTTLSPHANSTTFTSAFSSHMTSNGDSHGHSNNNGNIHGNGNHNGNRKSHEKEREKYVKTLREGSYFGERALLLNCERSANIIVSSQVLRCVAMDKASFLRFIDKTSVYDKVRRNIGQYTFTEKITYSF
ncbi:hypothetical protein RFI_15171 [Reticulomyxa filosa]|uniref:Cyclic nucleotide-binding domain-containing protein n=1 Tax=Reticulomyxa filosa TaxID=46433 RepID=X6N7Y5_RETFI|nr:hypothetical protein RFI_15171 [Reticulomyxa filosa]|eukprot:ETO22033.1 hypothetical protein RFI_15171 [Reticulomyxa filosa]